MRAEPRQPSQHLSSRPVNTNQTDSGFLSKLNNARNEFGKNSAIGHIKEKHVMTATTHGQTQTQTSNGVAGLYGHTVGAEPELDRIFEEIEDLSFVDGFYPTKIEQILEFQSYRNDEKSNDTTNHGAMRAEWIEKIAELIQSAINHANKIGTTMQEGVILSLPIAKQNTEASFSINKIDGKWSIRCSCENAEVEQWLKDHSGKLMTRLSKAQIPLNEIEIFQTQGVVCDEFLQPIRQK